MEEDAGKNIHGEGGDPNSYIDLNRTGVPLLEIVSEPDLHSGDEAAAYLKQLRAILRYLDISDGNMEEGSFRCDANVSIRPAGSRELGTRAEVKNLNSFRHVARAISHEAQRQARLVARGETVVQETRLWNEAEGKTVSMRSKEEAHDYRYFPDPDLVPLHVTREWIEAARRELPELPVDRAARFQTAYGLTAADAEILVASQALADYFETAASGVSSAKLAANWIMAELLAVLNKLAVGVEEAPVTAEQLAALLRLIENETISGKIGKKVFEKMVATGRAADAIVEEEGLVQVTDAAALRPVIEEIIDAHPEQRKQYAAGKSKLFGFFVGRVMQATRGKANPTLVNKLLQELLPPSDG
jgi:aspartyl-tRNA(Asn)/glutamyl-tRNA(Gln) amidotransferase subunit B